MTNDQHDRTINGKRDRTWRIWRVHPPILLGELWDRYFRILEMREKTGNRNQDAIIEKTYFLQCQRCGSEQMEHVLTIVPSWSGPCIDRDALPIWEGEGE